MNIPLSQFRITSDGYLRVLEAVFDLSFPMSLAELHVQKDSNLLLLSLAISTTNIADTTIKKAKPSASLSNYNSVSNFTVVTFVYPAGIFAC